jgi:hypothetical protein
MRQRITGRLDADQAFGAHVCAITPLMTSQASRIKMSAAKRLNAPMQAELDALEARMGELASLLSETADALTSYPESIRIIGADGETAPPSDTATMDLLVREWPTIQEIEQLLANWRRLWEMTGRR